jgi:hypothetical protein
MVKLPRRPELTADGYIMVPDEARRRAEAGIEVAANLIAVAERCKRTISSPTPALVLIPGGKTMLNWLNKSLGFKFNRFGIPSGRMYVETNPHILKQLRDRTDGLALMAEALANEHGTGRYREFIRLFERAFGLASSALDNQLARFLMSSSLGYSHSEVKQWVALRNPAIHANRGSAFVLESDVRPVIHRIEQAAYDVLLNKADWHSPSHRRRKVWMPTTGTTSPGTDIFLTREEAATLHFQIVDGFGAYPLDLSACLTRLPEGWWAGPPRTEVEDGESASSVDSGESA